MILKIRAGNPLTEDSWRFFDGVQGLHYNVYDAGIYALKEEEFRQKETIESVQYVRFWDALPPCKVILLTFDSETTGQIEITCNTTVYLLNDSGKTIERLI